MICVCKWLGDGSGCRQPAMHNKAYCEQHYIRVYDSYLPEMADYVLNKELNEDKTPIRYK